MHTEHRTRSEPGFESPALAKESRIRANRVNGGREKEEQNPESNLKRFSERLNFLDGAVDMRAEV